MAQKKHTGWERKRKRMIHIKMEATAAKAEKKSAKK